MSRRLLATTLLPAALTVAAGLTGCEGHRHCLRSEPAVCQSACAPGPQPYRCLPNEGTLLPVPHNSTVTPMPRAADEPRPMNPLPGGEPPPPAPPPPERQPIPMAVPRSSPGMPPTGPMPAPPAEAENGAFRVPAGNQPRGPMMPMPAQVSHRPVRFPVPAANQPGFHNAGWRPPQRGLPPGHRAVPPAVQLQGPQALPAVASTSPYPQGRLLAADPSEVPTIPWYMSSSALAEANEAFEAVEPWPYHVAGQSAAEEGMHLVPEPEVGPTLLTE